MHQAKPIQHLLLRRHVPVVSAVLLASCIVGTLPMFFDERFYLVLGVESPRIHWWHFVTATFVHGGGFPGKVAHLVVNGLFIAVFGSVIERTLGAGRLVLCSLTSWSMNRLGRWALWGSWYAHGISGATWGYCVLASPVLLRALRRARLSLLRDPIAVVALLLTVFGAIGAFAGLHALSLAVHAGFLILWRKLLRANLDQLERGGVPDTGPLPFRAAGISLVALVAALNAAVVVAAISGTIH
jgi:membrane associated rhomboid family serine protease